jgi:quinol monooxygenase YgiN
MPIRQVITFRVQAGKADDFVAGFAPIVEKVRREPGCEQYELLRSLDDPDTLVMLERWASLEALESALRAHYKGKDDPAVAFFQLVDGPPVRERYEV